LSDGATFVLGATGALAAFLFVDGIPFCRGLAEGKSAPVLTRTRILGGLGFLIFVLALGGFVAVGLGGVTEARQAMAYGAAWQGTMGAFVLGETTQAEPPSQTS
jgi:hypothetical protein